MKKLFIIANWKANKTVREAHGFLTTLLNDEFIEWLHTTRSTDQTDKQIIICPPLTALSDLSKLLSHYPDVPLRLGSQNVSAFSEGAHTGEESASQLAEFAKYVIVGHSERRRPPTGGGETDEDVAKKVVAAREYNLEPIVCVQSDTTPIPDNVHIVAYEPVDAISTGEVGIAANVIQVEKVVERIKRQHEIPYVLYGGSVTPENVKEYTSLPFINGVLVGGASLDPVSFSQIIKNA